MPRTSERAQLLHDIDAALEIAACSYLLASDEAEDEIEEESNAEHIQDLLEVRDIIAVYRYISHDTSAGIAFASFQAFLIAMFLLVVLPETKKPDDFVWFDELELEITPPLNWPMRVVAKCQGVTISDPGWDLTTPSISQISKISEAQKTSSSISYGIYTTT
ncbi:hypothetical protein BGX38DRAFT_1141107 [Terfezia claveryi]|nr:hypothetical protein BGX38DRAFT_1141107 [Terfezia claveryi]